MKLFGSSGIRRVADGGLLFLAMKAGMAVSRRYGRVVVGRDTRLSGPAVQRALTAGLLAGGAEVADGGIMPTPTLALAARRYDAGLMVTASHNPPQYNGIKFLNPDGSAFDPEQQAEIEEMIAQDRLEAAPWDQMGGGETIDGAVREHITRIRRDLPADLRLKVVLDCGGGAGAVITPRLLSEMGCEVIALNCRPDGRFPRDAEPTEANLGELIKMTRETGADLGIAHDGDADRLMLIDDRGRYLSGDKLLAIFARDMGAGEVVTTVDASMTIEEMGFQTTRTNVGDSYVSTALKKGGQAFGGEPSGAWIFPGMSLCPDGIYAAARAVSIAAKQKLSELADAIPEYPIIRGSLAANGNNPSRLEKELDSLQPLSVNQSDGLRLDFNDGWMLVRPSGTEPRIRLTVEARTEGAARQRYDDACAIIRRAQEAD